MMRSIMSITLTAVTLLFVLTGCGRTRDNTTDKPMVTTTPNQTVTTEKPADVVAPETIPETAGNATNRVENGIDDAMTGAENAMNDVVNGAENVVDDLLGDDGVINGDMGDGFVEDSQAREENVSTTPQAR